jgi:hypothetical protein
MRDRNIPTGGKAAKHGTARKRVYPRGMTHSHTMQEPLLDRPASVSALTPAGGRKEMTMNRALLWILVGFAGQP